MKNPQKESLPSLQPLQQRRRLRDFLTGAEHEAVKMPLQQRRRLRDFLTGTGYKAVKMPQPDGERRSKESSLTGEATVRTPAASSIDALDEATEKTPAVRAVKRSEETPAPLNIVPGNVRGDNASVRRAEETPAPMNRQMGQPTMPGRPIMREGTPVSMNRQMGQQTIPGRPIMKEGAPAPANRPVGQPPMPAPANRPVGQPPMSGPNRQVGQPTMPAPINRQVGQPPMPGTRPIIREGTPAYVNRQAGQPTMPAPMNRQAGPAPINRQVGPPPMNRQVGQQRMMRPESRKQTWRPGTFGFDNNDTADDVEEDDPDFDKLATIPMMVLRGISKQQGSPQPTMKSEISEAAGGAAFMSVGNIGGSVLKYGSNIVLQRGLGAPAFGLYSLSMAIVTLATAIFNLGLDDAMVRYVSIYRTKRQAGSLRGLMIFCTALAGASGILGALLVLYYAPFLAVWKHSTGELVPLLQMMAPLIPLTCLQTIWISGLQGFKDFKWRVLVQRIVIPLSLIVLLLVAIIISPNLTMVVFAIIINAAIGVVFSLYFFLRRVSEIMKPEPGAYQFREWFGFAIPNFLTSIIDTVLESTDTILLAYFAISPIGLAQYAAAIKLSGFILMPQASFNAIFAPTIAELHSLGETKKLEAMFKVVTKWAITFSLPIFGITVLFSRSLAGIGGNDFVAAWPLVIAFSLGTMINVSTGSVGYILLMTGHQRLSFINSLTAVVVNVAVGAILAPRYGAMGVAIATGLAVGVVNIMKLLQVRILVKMQPYGWDVLKPLGAVLISGTLTGILLYLISLAHLSIQISHYHLSFELGLVPVFLAIYFGLLYLFKVSPEDKIVLDALAKKIRRGKKKKGNKR